MAKFKIGDKVKVTRAMSVLDKPYVGKVGIIESLMFSMLGNNVWRTNIPDTFYFHESQLELISSAKDTMTKYVLIDSNDGATVLDSEDELIEFLEENDVDPDDVEVYAVKKEVTIERKSSYIIEE